MAEDHGPAVILADMIVAKQTTLTFVAHHSDTRPTSPGSSSEGSVPPPNLFCIERVVERRATRTMTIRPEILCRARMSLVLQGFGALWRASPVDLPLSEREHLRAISTECETIDALISQCWRSSGTGRYLALLVRFHCAPAAASGFGTLLLFMLLDLCGKLPTLEPVTHERLGWEVPSRTSIWSLVPPIVALVVLFIAQNYSRTSWTPSIP